MSSVEFCDQVEDALFEAVDSPGTDAFDDAVKAIRDASEQAPSDQLRDAGEALANAREDMLDVSGEGEDAGARLDAAEEARRAVEELCADDDGRSADEAAAPDELAEEEIDRAIDDALEKLRREGLDDIDMAEATEILESLGADEVAGLDDDELEELLSDASDLLEGLDLSGRGGSESGMDDAFAECNSDIEADGPGDNAGCDELYDACETGDDAACNDLWTVAPIGSRYVTFAETCGGRADEPAFGTC